MYGHERVGRMNNLALDNENVFDLPTDSDTERHDMPVHFCIVGIFEPNCIPQEVTGCNDEYQGARDQKDSLAAGCRGFALLPLGLRIGGGVIPPRTCFLFINLDGSRATIVRHYFPPRYWP